MTTIEKIEYATRNIIVLSIAYYELNYNLVEDKVYDKRLKWLCDYVNKNRDVADSCYYVNVLKDIDPSTGFDLVYKLADEHREYLTQIANYCIQLHKQDNIRQKGR